MQGQAVPDSFHDMSHQDMAAHEQTYRGFVGLVKGGTIAVVVLLVLMAIFLV